MKHFRKKNIPQDSATVLINSLAQQKINEGIHIYNLSAGEPKLMPHPDIVSAVTQALEKGHTLYPPVAGIPKLRSLASQWMNEFYYCSFEKENCLVVNGGKFGLYLVLQLLMEEDDEIIIPSPFWVSYPALAKLFGGIPVFVETQETEGWKLTPQALKDACTTKSKFLILNNASNPTGALYTQSELQALIETAREHDLFIIADEVYSALTYDKHHYISCGSFPEFKDRVIIIQSCSKNFSMTGWRIGFVFAEQPLIQALTSLISQSTSGVTSISQWAAVGAFQEVNQISAEVQQCMQQRRDILIDAFQKYFALSIKPPKSSLYVFISLKNLGSKLQDSTEFCKRALDEAHVALVPGVAFGKEGYVRLSFGGCETDLVSGIHALAQWLQSSSRKNYSP
ncbi:aspartate aminotransferase [Legionella wadsworthii]|uniref:Aminotransferase n=1 Tax=Legionella wadsworthii TaxID=28088 RepID=A0A378LNI7_9GAMM|nr:aminotransferase class I/II-fold pyridoxal phosphate-dependent enzyme [Legionella wadsworthii]STY28247.1 aspartate aminotransferase [Legionella wadsworthii]